MEKNISSSPIDEPMPQHEASSEDTDTPFEYKILTEGYESTGNWISGQKLRMDYLQLTDKLIHTIREGVEVTNQDTGETERRPYSTLVFLDKSARPISHLVRELWPLFAKDEMSGEVPPMPAIKFLNIDRRQWIDQVDPSGSGLIDIDNLHPSIIRSLRSIFLSPEGKRQVEENGLTEEVDTMPAILDDENILVVDETYFSGETAKVATGLLKRAFPTAHIEATHWIRQKANGHARNPKWYSDATPMGRGVGERYSEVKSTASSEQNYYSKFGKYFLSAPHWRRVPGLRDESYYQLVDEIKELTHNPDVPVIPDYKREDIDDRIVAYNGGDPSRLTEEQKDEAIRTVSARKRAIDDDPKNARP